MKRFESKPIQQVIFMASHIGIISLVTGILAFVLNIFGLPLAIIAIITGIIGRGKRKQKLMATIGLILGMVYIILLLIGSIVGMILGAIPFI